MQIVKNFCDVCGLEVSNALGNYPATLNIKNPNGKSFFHSLLAIKLLLGLQTLILLELEGFSCKK
jgi:hypothetical protein